MQDSTAASDTEQVQTSLQNIDLSADITLTEDEFEDFVRKIVEVEALEVRLLDESGNEKDKSEFSWSIVDYESRELKLQLDFNDAVNVSS